MMNEDAIEDYNEERQWLEDAIEDAENNVGCALGDLRAAECELNSLRVELEQLSLEDFVNE